VTDKKPKEPMIGEQNRPSPIDFDTPITELTMRDLATVFQGQFVEKEQVKEFSKPEKEWIKVERLKELQFKEFKELQFKEVFKGDIIKEFKPPELKPPELKPESAAGGIDQATIDQIADRVADVLERRGRG
jgi:hypothetical protein